MTKLRATITDTITTDLLLEAPDDMTLDEVKQAAVDGDLLDSCEVLEESDTDRTDTKLNVYAYGDQEVNTKVLPRVWLVIQHQSSDPEFDGRTVYVCKTEELAKYATIKLNKRYADNIELDDEGLAMDVIDEHLDSHYYTYESYAIEETQKDIDEYDLGI